MSNYLPKATDTRPDPEVLLRHVQAEEERQRRGRLKIFLGYTSGVGKSRRMLDEGRRRHDRGGEDVVVGALQPAVSPDVQALVEKMEVIPLLKREGIPMMNVAAILRRRPGVCLVDGLAFDNPPGSVHAKRWQDVEQLLEAGISVLASLNLQHIEEYRDQVEELTGKYVRETVPKAFIYQADEIEVVDVPAEACPEPEGDATAAPEAGRRQHLSELREIVLLLVADIVDRRLQAYLHSSGIELSWGVQERFLVLVSSEANAAKMIDSGRRNADRFHGDFYAAYLDRPDLAPDGRRILEANLEIARRHGAQIEAMDGEDSVEAVMRFARARGITQIFVAQSPKLNWFDRLWGSEVDGLIRQAEGIDVRVFPR